MQNLFIGNYCNNEMEILNLNNEMLATEKFKTKIYKKNPSYICIYNDFLYSVAEIQDNTVNSGYVLAYKIINNGLKFLNEKISYGNDPCYITYNKLFNILFVANYTGGSFSVFKINEDGSIGNTLYIRKFWHKF